MDKYLTQVPKGSIQQCVFAFGQKYIIFPSITSYKCVGYPKMVFQSTYNRSISAGKRKMSGSCVGPGDKVDGMACGPTRTWQAGEAGDFFRKSSSCFKEISLNVPLAKVISSSPVLTSGTLHFFFEKKVARCMCITCCNQGVFPSFCIFMFTKRFSSKLSIE